jgi:hypothetical protein
MIPPLRMIHRQRGGYGRIFLRVLASWHAAAGRPNLRLGLANSAAHRRLSPDPTGALASPRRTAHDHRLVERIRAATRTIVERSRTLETLAPPAIPAPRTAPPLATRPVPPRKAPSPGWVQPPPMPVVRQRLAALAQPAPERRLSGASGDRRPVAAAAPLRWDEPAPGSLPLGRLQIERLTEEVIRGIDRRFVSLRERMGRG